MGAPLFKAVYEFGIPLTSLIMAIILLRAAIREGELSRAALLYLGGVTMWWQEWYCDWASYLVFNMDFAQIPWGPTPWTAPSKPWAVIPSYGWYFGLAFGLMAWLVDRVRARNPKLGNFWACVVVVGPLFYVWDLLVEGSATALNWWEYTNNIGPELKTANGNFPIVWPISLFVVTAIVMVWLFIKRDGEKLFPYERLFGIATKPHGLAREFSRFVAAAIVMNVSFGLMLTLPTCLLRYFFGGPSLIVP